MKSEVLFMGLLPTIIALIAVIVSLVISFKIRRASHFLLSCMVGVGVAWSLMILYRIFILGAWPTCLPHLVIGVVFIIVILQSILYGRQKSYSLE